MIKKLLKEYLGPFVSGILLAVGLGMSGMTEPKKILGFLDVFGKWDPTLLFVMVGAISVHAVCYQLITKRSSPLFEVSFQIPEKRDIDFRLLIGSAIFGLGWGVTGLCPGPGIVGLASGVDYGKVFVALMLVGVLAAKWFLQILQFKK